MQQRKELLPLSAEADWNVVPLHRHQERTAGTSSSAAWRAHEETEDSWFASHGRVGKPTRDELEVRHLQKQIAILRRRLGELERIASVLIGHLSVDHLLAIHPKGAELIGEQPALELTQESPLSSSTRSEFLRNMDWIRDEGKAFVGEWVALRSGQLIDHDKSRLALHRRLETAGLLDRTLLFAKVE